MNPWVRWITASALITVAINHVEAQVALSAAGDGHDVVPVTVNGRGPYSFVLDTGADGSAVYQWFADKAMLKKAPGGTEELSGQTGSSQVTMYSIGSLELDGYRLRHAKAYGLPNRHDSGKEAGVLGNDFMDGAVVAFDYPCRRVEVHAKPIDQDKVIGKGAPATLSGHVKGNDLLILPVMVNGVSGMAILDTGSRNTRMTTSFARAAGIDASSSEFHDGEPIYGANSKPMVPRSGPIGSVGFAGVSVNAVTAQVIDLPVLKEDFGDKPAMLLGADLLGNFRLLYDHQARVIWVRPSSCSASK